MEIQIIDKNTLEIVSEVRQKWTRENLESDIEILTKQCDDMQQEIKEKKELLARLG